jgi:hypothetical protein
VNEPLVGIIRLNGMLLAYSINFAFYFSVVCVESLVFYF